MSFDVFGEKDRMRAKDFQLPSPYPSPALRPE